MILTEEEILEVRKLLSIKCTTQLPDPFNFQPQCWKKWKKRFRRYLRALDKNLQSTTCTELYEYDRINLLIYLLGEYAEETFGILQNAGWIFPDTLEKTIESLDLHFKRLMVKQDSLYVRLYFHRRAQMRGQSVTEYIKAIEFLAAPCNFGEAYDLMLRDKMIIGINSETARAKMFSYSNRLTYEMACTVAFNDELRRGRKPG